jgi:hypothetical protein
MGIVERTLRLVFPNQDITHQGDLYLRRWLLTPSVCGWRLMLHKIARPDRDRALHDHPWDFATLCLRGGYVEELWDGGGAAEREHVLVPGDVRLRAAEHTHRIARIMGAAAWTLVLHGPRRRAWGFWDAETGEFTVSHEYFREGYDRASQMQRRAA